MNRGLLPSKRKRTSNIDRDFGQIMLPKVMKQNKIHFSIKCSYACPDLALGEDVPFLPSLLALSFPQMSRLMLSFAGPPSSGIDLRVNSCAKVLRLVLVHILPSQNRQESCVPFHRPLQHVPKSSEWYQTAGTWFICWCTRDYFSPGFREACCQLTVRLFNWM